MTSRQSPGSTGPGPTADKQPRRISQVICIVVSGAVLVVLNLVTIFCVISAWTMTPANAYDEDILLGITVAAFLGIALAFVTALLTLIPVTAGWLSKWWYIIPALLFVLALARWVHIEIVYPEEPGLYMNLR